MNGSEEKFEVNYEGKPVIVEQISLGGQTMFRIIAENLAPFFITRTQNYQTKFWTSVPEGKQKLAEAIGALIEEKYKPE